MVPLDEAFAAAGLGQAAAPEVTGQADAARRLGDVPAPDWNSFGAEALAAEQAQVDATAGPPRDLTVQLAEHLPAGPGLAAWLSTADPGAATDYDLPGIAAGYRRAAAWAQAQELAAVAEMTARAAARDRKAGLEEDGRPVRVTAAAATEVALALVQTQTGASWWASLAVALRWRLRPTGDALAAGQIDLPRARLIHEATARLDEETAQKVEALVLPRAGEKTTAQLRVALRRAVIAADPEGAEGRRIEAETRAKVSLYPDEDGTGTLSATHLPGLTAAAMWARITALARAMKAAGHGGGLDYLRAQVLAGLALGTLPLIGPPASSPPGDPGPSDPGDGPGPGHGGSGPDTGSGRSGRHPDGSDPDGDTSGRSNRGDSGPGDIGSGSGTGRQDHPPGGSGPADEPSSDEPPGDPPGSPFSDWPPPSPAPGDPPGARPVRSERRYLLDPDPDPEHRSSSSMFLSLWPSLPVTIADTPAVLGDGPSPPWLSQGKPGAVGNQASAGSGSTAPRIDSAGTTTRPAGLLDLTIPWSAFTGNTGGPAHLGFFGPITAPQARLLACTAVPDPHAQWRVILTDPGGHATAVERVRRGKRICPPQPGRPPGVLGRVTVTLPAAALEDPPPVTGGSGTTIGAAILRAAARAAARAAREQDADQHAPGGCAHAAAAPGYRPPPRLREYVEARDQTCRQPTCRQPAWRADLDHTQPFHLGGRTCKCNIGGFCRTHHQVKQEPGWHVAQPRPGHFQITTPGGRNYAVVPDTYPA